VRKANCLSSGPCGVTVEVTRQQAFAECSKRCVYVYTPPLLLAYHAIYSVGYSNCIQNEPHDCRWPAKTMGSKVKTVSRVSTAESKQMVTSNWHTRAPLRGPDILKCCWYLSPDRDVFFMPVRVGWHLAVRVFPPRITRESHVKPPI
jgi:hypothetical protein